MSLKTCWDFLSIFKIVCLTSEHLRRCMHFFLLEYSAIHSTLTTNMTNTSIPKSCGAANHITSTWLISRMTILTAVSLSFLNFSIKQKMFYYKKIKEEEVWSAVVVSCPADSQNCILATFG